MRKDYMAMPRVYIDVDAQARRGEFEWWRHCLGHGAVNSAPLPERVMSGIQKLKPRLIRILLQEYFGVYPDHGVFDWSKLDAYMESFARTGTKLIANVTMKPPALYPTVDESIWRPNDIGEWQNLVYQVVRRYSVEKPIVTHWEHTNEPEMGEAGACPFYIPTVRENYEFYLMMIKPILEACPTAKVGGPAAYCRDSAVLKEFIELCRTNNTPLDFVSWHCYNDSPAYFKEQVEELERMIEVFPEDRRPELMLGEIAKGFDFQDQNHPHPNYYFISVEDQALSSRRAAHIVSVILHLMETKLSWSQYFPLWDVCLHPGEFASFFSEKGIRGMYKHWNEAPHRFGLFSEGQAVRPQYFAYLLLSRMEGEAVDTVCGDPDIKAKAAAGDGKLSVILANYSCQSTRDTIVNYRFKNLNPGVKKLTIYRIDDDWRWDGERFELIPVERRTVDTLREFEYQCYVPEDSVAFITLEDQ